MQSYAITWADKRNILLSLLSFIGFICYGYFACGLGASIPLIASQLNKNETDLGILFTSRGIGFMCGTVVYTLYVTFDYSKYLRNEILITISVAIAGIGSCLLLIMTNLWVIMMVVFVQGFVFAGIDIIANILLPNLWKSRVQPWLQALHACWSLGGIIGPAIVGSIGYHGSNLILMILCFIPLGLLLVNDLLESESLQAVIPSKKSFQYLLKLGEVSHSLSLKKQKKMKEQSSNGGGQVKSSSVDSQDDEDEDEDDDYDTRIQIRPLQENKVTSSNYISSSSSPIPSLDPFDERASNHYFSPTGGEDYDGDGEEIESPSASPTRQKSSLLSPALSDSPLHRDLKVHEPHQEDPTTPAASEDYWILPNSIRACLFCFYFIYVGLETGYGGWIPTYALEMSIAKNDADAAYLASIFFFSISAGRLAAIPLASIYTPNFLLRIQLVIVIIAMILVVTIGTGAMGYSGLAIATAVLGYGVSCIFPLGLSVTQDFQKLLMFAPFLALLL